MKLTCSTLKWLHQAIIIIKIELVFVGVVRVFISFSRTEYMDVEEIESGAGGRCDQRYDKCV